MHVAQMAAALLVLAAGVARAAPHTIMYSPVDLANGSLYLPDDAELPDGDGQLSFGAGGGKCDVAVADHAVAPLEPGGCAQLFAIADLKRVDARLTTAEGTLDLSFVPAVIGSPVRLSLQGSAAVAPAGFPDGIAEVAVLQYDGPATSARPVAWVMTAVSDKQIALEGTTAEIAKRLAGRFRVYGVDYSNEESPRVLEFQVIGAASATPVMTNPSELMTPAAPDDPLATDPDYARMLANPADPDAPLAIQALPPGSHIPPDLQCPPKKLSHPDMIVVCVDATGPTINYKLLPEGTRLTKPNRYFYVHVVHHAQNRVAMDLGGQIGSFVPGTRGRAELSKGGFGLDGQVANDVVLVTTSRTFAPRRPGFAPLVVRLFDDARQPVRDPLILEFWIEETFAGAFRVGIAGTFFGGVEQQYSAVTRPNSQQQEIAATGENVMDIDLMLGYSPYLDSGGRPASGCENAPFCFNPYFGIGLLNADDGGNLEFLKSVHLGVEWELTNEFAVGVTANVRRVQRLADGLAPGYPIDGDIPREDRYVFGVGVVINLSPSFLRIGAGGAAELLK